MKQEGYFSSLNELKIPKKLQISWLGQQQIHDLKYSVSISPNINIIIRFNFSSNDGTCVEVSGHFAYKNGQPILIPLQYTTAFEQRINDHQKHIQIKFNPYDSAEFALIIPGIQPFLHQTQTQHQFQSKIKNQIQKICIHFQETFLLMGLLKKGNKWSKFIKAQELLLKKKVIDAMKKDQNILPRLNIQQTGSLLKKAEQITPVPEIKEGKSSEGGYFLVRNNIFTIKQSYNNTFNRHLAYKQIKNTFQQSNSIQNKLQKQIKIINKIHNPEHFLTFWQEVPTNKIFMEYLPKTLKFQLKWKIFSIADIILILKQIIDSVFQLHRIGVVHRDVKAQNFLIDENNGKYLLKLIDFGQSVFIHQPLSQSILPLAYTLPYSPFQCIKDDQTGTKMKEIDYWSVGILAHELIYRKYPFTYGNYIALNIIEDWLSKNTEFEIYTNKRRKRGLRLVEEMGTMMVENCLKVRQKERINLSQMAVILDNCQLFIKQLKCKNV